MFVVADAMLWVSIVQCKHNKITAVLVCLLTNVLGSTVTIYRRNLGGCGSEPPLFGVEERTSHFLSPSSQEFCFQNDVNNAEYKPCNLLKRHKLYS